MATCTVKYMDFELAVDFASAGMSFAGDCWACLYIKTGEFYYLGDGLENDIDQEILDEIEFNPDAYIRIPDRKEFDLGTPLIFRFTDEYMLGDYEQVRQIFRRRGAYAKYKNLLDKRGLLDTWYDYENTAFKAALLEWAEAKGIQVEK